MKVGCWTIKINIAHLAVTYLLCQQIRRLTIAAISGDGNVPNHLVWEEGHCEYKDKIFSGGDTVIPFINLPQNQL